VSPARRDRPRAGNEIVDEDALYDALSRRSIAGAALDVWCQLG
jgi:phosphoglycerate dehydrogenase-like enzyme